MSLYVDKYRPKSLEKLDYHKEQAEHLKTLVASSDFPHLIFYGPPGAGKKTRIMCLLKEIYGAGVERVRIDQRSFDLPSGKKLDLSCLTSNYHIELNPSEVGHQDRFVVQDVVKSMAQMGQLSKAQKNFKVVLLTAADKLTRDAQNALRRTMEKYAKNCRIILYCTSISKLMPPLRSRCLCIRVPAPSSDEALAILKQVAKKEHLNLPDDLASDIINKSGRNMRRALLYLECARAEARNYNLENIKCPEFDWQNYLRETAVKLLQEQSPARLKDVRARFYELLGHLIPTDIIFRGLLQELLPNLDSILKAKVVAIAAEYETNIHLGSKAIYHLEAFAAKFMFLYREYLESATMEFA